MAESALRARDWPEADHLAAECCSLRPDWSKGYLLRRLTLTRLGRPKEVALNVLCMGIARCAAGDGAWEDLSEVLASSRKPCEKSGADEGAITATAGQLKCKVKGLKPLPHELALYVAGELEDVTHEGSSAIWLSGASAPSREGSCLVYRPMGDAECAHLLRHGILPETQPYQTIVRGDEGRGYAEKYLRGHKMVDSSPTTVIEFDAPRELIERLFAMQSKNEDGAISHGLGDKGGRGLPLFNASLQSGNTTFRIVFVKRFERKAVGAFGASRRKI